MNILIAPDSYKGSLTSPQVARIMKEAIQSLHYGDHVIEKPMADGGEGTVDALLTASGGTRIPVCCHGPLGEKIETYYAILDDGTAVIEIANIAGLTQVPKEKQNPDNTTTYGLGEVIKDALNRNCKTLIIGLGGSATNDAGLGMLLSLGMQAWNCDGEEIDMYGRNLLEVDRIEIKGLDQRLSDVSIKVACDVENPLYGENGASAIFGPQKGASQEQISCYDQAMKRFAGLIETQLGSKDLSSIPGTGAAGGLGFAFHLLGAKLISGAKLVGEASGLEEAIKQSDLVITGEGQSDAQTLFGKAPGYIADLASSYHVPTVLISGSLSADTEALLQKFAGCFSIINRPLTLKACMEQAEELIFQQTKQVVHLVRGVE